MDFAKYEFSNNITDQTGLVKYIVAKNGNFSLRENKVIKAITKYEEKFDNLPEMSEEISFKLPIIPFSLFSDMVSFFKKIYLKDKTESSLFLFHNEKKGYFLWAPKQLNSGASSKYERDSDPEYTQMCQENTLCMMAHSHPWKSTQTSPSGIDDTDEKDILLYLVVGNVEGIPNVYLSTCPNGKRIKLNFFDFFENPFIETLKTLPKETLDYVLSNIDKNKVSEIFKQFLVVDTDKVPEEWVAKCKTNQATITKKYDKVSYLGSSKKDFDDDFDFSRYEREYFNDYHLGGYDYLDQWPPRTFQDEKKEIHSLYERHYPIKSKKGSAKEIKKNKKNQAKNNQKLALTKENLYEPPSLKEILSTLPSSMNWLLDILSDNEDFKNYLPKEVTN